VFKHLILLFAAVAALGAEPALERASVTIPYSELKTLWQAAQPQPLSAPEPPVAAELLAARYDLTCQPGQLRGTAEFDVQCFQNKWTTIPLVGAWAQVDAIEPADANVIVKNGSYTLVLERAGRSKIKLHFAAKLASDGETDSLRLAISPATINTLTLDAIPDGKTVQVEGGTAIVIEKNKAAFRLPAKDLLDLSLHTIAAPLPPPTPSRWRVNAESLVQFADGKLNYETMLAARADVGSGLSMDLQLPAGAHVTDVAGDDIVRWRCADTLHIEWKTRDVLSRVIAVICEIPFAAAPGDWQLAAPKVIDGENGEPLFAMLSDPELELSAKQATNVRLPRWLAEKTTGKNVITIGGDGALIASWRPLIHTTSAVIESVQSSMRVVGDGALINEMTYVIRHDGALAWKLNLPASSQLLTCAVNRRETNPIDRGNGTIELQFNGSDDRQQRTEVSLSYTNKKQAFQPVSGQLEVELPSSDLLANRIDWNLQIPAAYEITALEGNVESAAAGTSGAIKLRKELCKGERPTAQLFYQKPEAR